MPVMPSSSPAEAVRAAYAGDLQALAGKGADPVSYETPDANTLRVTFPTDQENNLASSFLVHSLDGVTITYGPDDSGAMPFEKARAGAEFLAQLPGVVNTSFAQAPMDPQLQRIVLTAANQDIVAHLTPLLPDPKVSISSAI